MSESIEQSCRGKQDRGENNKSESCCLWLLVGWLVGCWEHVFEQKDAKVDEIETCISRLCEREGVSRVKSRASANKFKWQKNRKM